jgi:transcriptional regulator with XRE-family HTH domain
VTQDAETSKRSRFAEAVASLLDATGLYDRASWASFLGVSEAAISQWVNDRTIPRPDLLWLVLGLLEEKDSVAKEPVTAFLAIMDVPSQELSPHGDRFGPTLGDYLTANLSRLYLGVLSDLPFRRREQALYEAIGRARALKKTPHEQQGSHTIDRIPSQTPNGTGTAAHGKRIAASTRRRNEASANDGIAPVVFRGRRVALFLRTGRKAIGVLSANGLRQELVGLFGAPGTPNVHGTPSLASMLWKIPQEAQSFGAFGVDEMLFVLLKGSVSWHYEGVEQPFTLSARPNCPRLFWVPGIPRHREASVLPPFMVRAKSNYAVGLVLFYSKFGVNFSERGHGQIAMHTLPWADGDAHEYWTRMRQREAQDGRTMPPIIGRLPSTQESIGPVSHSRNLGTNLHDMAVRDKQWYYEEIPSWRIGPSAVLRPSIIRLPAHAAANTADIWLASHRGAELVLPLSGIVELVSVELKPAETELASVRASSFDCRRWMMSRAASARESRSGFADIAMVSTEASHGFRGIGSRNASALLVRCAADLVGRERLPKPEVGIARPESDDDREIR